MANPNPLVGVIYHWIGGLSSASFYVPYKKIKLWSWEIFWITGGIFSWLFAPWIGAFAQTENLLEVLSATPLSVLGWCYFWGAMWGLGGLTFGLTMRYLGLSLGMAVALGLTTVIGTMGPPIFHGTLGELASTTSGMTTFMGIVVTLVGIVVVAMAGKQREHELGEDISEAGDTEFDLKKGLMIAVFSGVMSGCFAWGLDAGQAIRDLTLEQGTNPLNQGLPVLCVVLAGGLTTNLIWCAILIAKNGSLPELTGQMADGTRLDTKTLMVNYGLAALGGTIWYLQFFFYTMGESQMGKYGFSSWTLHMASIILFSTLWGFALSEWKGVSTSARRKVWLGIILLVGSTVIIGVGNWLAG